MGEGRLLAEELEERLEAVFAARTYGELDALVADLPVPRPRRQPVRRQLSPAHYVVGAALMVFALPVLVALVVAAVVLAFTGFAAMWVLWLALAWFFFGHRRVRYASRRRVHWTRF
jgi:sterol desaturase/sphingolipid hydroxylase (fatty acid hydroxylase superfamily)